MSASALPTVFVPGLITSPRLYAEQLPACWRFGPVTVADNTRHDSVAALAAALLAQAPPRFALVGLSMGGYIAFEVLRQAPERVAKLALLDTAARADTPEQTENRRKQIAQAEAGEFQAVLDTIYPKLVHPSRHEDAALRDTFQRMPMEAGPEAFVRQQKAIIGRPDSRPGLPAIAVPTLVLVGDGDQLTPPERAAEMAAAIPGARHVVVPQCGHLSTLERPEAVTQALVEWLQR